jgi:ribosomal RNA methyltransferase Nop2
MGRRAKGKQGDPAPLGGKPNFADRSSAKKLGKRKAEDTDGGKSARPAKKVKDDRTVKKLPGGKVRVTTKITKEKVVTFDDDEEAGSQGWEDVDDDEDLVGDSK